MDRLAQDLRIALRALRRTPTFTIAVVLILGLGIGMSVAMFTTFRTILVRRLPVQDQDRIAVLWTYRVPTVEFSLPASDLSGHQAREQDNTGHRRRSALGGRGLAASRRRPHRLTPRRGCDRQLLRRARRSAGCTGASCRPEDAGAWCATESMVLSYGALAVAVRGQPIGHWPPTYESMVAPAGYDRGRRTPWSRLSGRERMLDADRAR